LRRGDLLFFVAEEDSRSPGPHVLRWLIQICAAARGMTVLLGLLQHREPQLTSGTQSRIARENDCLASMSSLKGKQLLIYTGITNALSRRVFEHKTGRIPGFTQKYKVHRLVYFESW